MSTYIWNAASTTTLAAVRGDTFQLSGVSAANVTVKVANGGFTLATPLGTLTVQCGDVQRLEDLALFDFTFADGTRLGFATEETDPAASEGDDQLLGSRVGDTLEGGAGNDILTGLAGDDTLLGGAGNDLLDGGDDFNFLFGGDGDDTYIVRTPFNAIFDSGGNDRGIVGTDFFKTDPSIEQWVWDDGILKLPYWIDALTFGTSPVFAFSLGANPVIEFSIAQELPAWLDAEDALDFTPFNADQIAYLRLALDYVSSVVNVTFREVPVGAGDDGFTFIVGNNTQLETAGYANPIHPRETGVLMLDRSDPDLAQPSRDNGAYFYQVLLHELGHVLGLKHPFDGDAVSGNTNEGPYLPSEEDNDDWTVMSYTVLQSDRGLQLSPFDIAALHYMYGPSNRLAPGDDVYAVRADRPNFIADGGGKDTITAAGQDLPTVIDLNDGMLGQVGDEPALLASSPGVISASFGSAIENAIGGNADDFISGNYLDNRLEGGGGDDFLLGGAGDDILLGGAGMDFLWAGSGKDQLDGSAGLDFAAYQLDSAAYAIQRTGGALTVTTNGTADSDTLSNIERIVFDDRVRAYDVDGNGGKLYRLYQASFDRTPDAAGIGFWLGQLDDGASLESIAGGFLASPEFVALYGASPTPEAFIARLYNNVLHRPFEQDGYDFWLAAMKQHGSSAESVLLAFSDSGENVALVNPTIQDGFWYTPA